MISKIAESHLISFWHCSTKVILKWAFNKCADRRRARMICLPDYRPHQILLELQRSMNLWLIAGFSRITKRVKAVYFSFIVSIFWIDQKEHIFYSVIE